MDAHAKAELLTQVDFFKACTESELAEIAELTVERRLEAGDVLCAQGERGTDAFVLLDGAASVHVNGSHVAEIGPGEVVGELAVERGGVRSATLLAMTPLHVLVVEPRGIKSVLAAHPGAAKHLGPRHPGDDFYPERRP